MNENGFFKFVNRFNSVVFMLALIGAVTSLAYFNLAANRWENRRAVTVNDGSEKEEKKDLILGRLQPISGTKFYYVPLEERDSSPAFSSGGGYTAGTRNVLFFKEGNDNNYWLFEKNNLLIDNMRLLKLGEYNSKEPVLAFMYEVVSKDSNENEKLDRNDRRSIAFSKNDGTDFVTVIENVDSLVGDTLNTEGTEIALIYQVGEAVFLEKISLTDFRSISKTEIKRIQKI